MIFFSLYIENLGFKKLFTMTLDAKTVHFLGF